MSLGKALGLSLMTDGHCSVPGAAVPRSSSEIAAFGVVKTQCNPPQRP